MEITVTEMNASDEIMIRTQFIEYSFRLDDPMYRKGFLRGGQLGMLEHEAVFAGIVRRRLFTLSECFF
jgi:hypothetical protein